MSSSNCCFLTCIQISHREEHWCHLRNAKLIGVPQINSRWSTFPLHWIHSRLSFHIICNKCLVRDYLRHPSQVYRNINFSKATGWKTRAPHIVWTHPAGDYHIGQCHSGVVCFEHRLFRTLLFKLKIKHILHGLIYMTWKNQLPDISGPITPLPPSSITSKLTYILCVIHTWTTHMKPVCKMNTPPLPHGLNTPLSLLHLPYSSTRQLPFLAPPTTLSRGVLYLTVSPPVREL